MESGRSRTGASSATSRREMRAARGARRRPGGAAWIPRAVVLAALAVATIAVPVLEASAPTAATTAVAQPTGLPSALDVLTGSVDQSTPTSLLAAVQGASRVSEVASRSLDREPLPGCDGEPRRGATNGQIPSSDLCTLWDGTNMLRGDAAVALSELNLNYRAAFGSDLCITDSYRSYAEQRRLAYIKPGLATTPGTSNHGWGLAIDLCSSETRGESFAWLADNGPTFGWVNPDWARRGGRGPYEPWHWEYLPGTIELGTDYSR